jgi:hypothetical protein
VLTRPHDKQFSGQASQVSPAPTPNPSVHRSHLPGPFLSQIPSQLAVEQAPQELPVASGPNPFLQRVHFSAVFPHTKQSAPQSSHTTGVPDERPFFSTQLKQFCSAASHVRHADSVGPHVCPSAC